jgi:hypothetical protein
MYSFFPTILHTYPTHRILTIPTTLGDLYKSQSSSSSRIFLSLSHNFIRPSSEYFSENCFQTCNWCSLPEVRYHVSHPYKPTDKCIILYFQLSELAVTTNSLLVRVHEEAGIAQSVQWLRYGVADRSSIPSRGRDYFSLRHRLQTSSGVHPASYPMCTGSSFFECKRPEREAKCSPSSSVEVKSAWS